MSGYDKALFPISVGNRLFTTPLVLALLEDLTERHGELVILVADKLQLYNHARNVRNGAVLAEILTDYRVKNKDLESRRGWLERIRRKIGKARSWRVESLDSVADFRFVNALRNVLIAFDTIDAFRNDVSQAARSYLIKSRRSVSPVGLRLSESYILEEIALNLRLRVVDEIQSEYYIGSYLNPLINVYRGKYGFDPHALAGMPSRDVSFRFFSLASSSPVQWEEVLTRDTSSGSQNKNGECRDISSLRRAE